jgi:hypothetical protein
VTPEEIRRFWERVELQLSTSKIWPAAARLPAGSSVLRDWVMAARQLSTWQTSDEKPFTA